MADRLALHGGEAVRGEFLPFHRPWIDGAVIKEVVEALESGWITRGPRTERFEETFRRYVGSRYAIALNSCTAGLHLALVAVGIGPGAEVITAPITVPATANVIVHQIVAALKAENIGTGIHFRALHLHRFFRDAYGFMPGSCPVAEWASERLLSLPLYPRMTRDDIEDVIAAVKKVLAFYAR